MWSKIAQILTLALFWCSSAYAGDEGKFTLLPKGGTTPFEATCFDNVATARLLTWREFLEQEMIEEREFALDFQMELFRFEIENTKIEKEEAIFRFEESIRLRDTEIESLRDIIKKDKKVNLPVVIGSSVVAGFASGLGTYHLIGK